MRFVLNLKHVARASVFLSFTLLFSCHRHIGEPGIAAAEVIKITGSNYATDSLIMQDANGKPADTFYIEKGKRIQWILQTKTVKNIDSIYKKTTSQNVFSELPHRLSNSMNWHGKIKKSAGGKAEDYNIDWTDTAGIKHTYDPKIQVR